MKTTETTTQRHADRIVKVTVETTPAQVDFNDILDAAEIVHDPDFEGPAEDEGQAHEIESAESFEEAHEGADASEMRGYHFREGWRENHVVTIPRHIAQGWGIYEQQRGESKQQAAERAAANIARTIEGITKWYRNGGQDAYGVTVEYEGYSASLWGIDDYEYAYNQTRREVAEEVAYEMEQAGYEITNKEQPEAAKQTAAQRLAVRKANRGYHDDREILVKSKSEYKARHARRHRTHAGERARRLAETASHSAQTRRAA